MKDKFPGYFSGTADELKKVWGECLFVVDANVLINLYRYSDATRVEFLKILQKVSSRIWMPYRAAEEYFNNRLKVIGEQEKSYDDAVSKIEFIKNNFNSSRSHPFISRELKESAEKVFDELCGELAESKKEHARRVYDDEIKAAVAELFEGKVGDKFEKDDLEKIFEEGRERYEESVPPGYKDKSKIVDDSISAKSRGYGDLIIWKEIIRKSKEDDVSIIFVTDDRKEDWWEIQNGKTIGPRPELIKEFREEAKNYIQIYQAHRFLEFANSVYDENVSDEMVSEVRDVRKGVRAKFEEPKGDSDVAYFLDLYESLNDEILRRDEVVDSYRDYVMELLSYGRSLRDKILLLNKDRSSTGRAGESDVELYENLASELRNNEKKIENIKEKIEREHVNKRDLQRSLENIERHIGIESVAWKG